MNIRFMPPRQNAVKRWAFTVNTPTASESDLLDGLVASGVCRYLIYGREIGDSGESTSLKNSNNFLFFLLQERSTSRDIWSSPSPQDSPLSSVILRWQERTSSQPEAPRPRISSTALRRIQNRRSSVSQPSLPMLLAARATGRGTRLLVTWHAAATLTTSTLTSFFDVTPLFVQSTTRPSGSRRDAEYISLTLCFGSGNPAFSLASNFHPTNGRLSSSSIRSALLARVRCAAGSWLIPLGEISVRFYTRAVVWIWPTSPSHAEYFYWIAPVQVENSFHGQPSRP